MAEKYRPMKGDEVEVILRGRVNSVGNTYFEIGGRRGGENAIAPTDDHVVSIRRIDPPLPTAPGSIIREVGRSLYVLGSDGEWYSIQDLHYGPLRGRVFHDYKVVFDAGAVK